MEKLIINGKKPLEGEIRIQGSKNALLPILAATFLTKGNVCLHNCPCISDANNMLDILELLGADVQRKDNDIYISTSSADSYIMPDKQSREMRSSIFMLGSILSRFGRVCCVYPGGCDIGVRPIDLHLKGLRDLGVNVTENDGRICCFKENAHSTELHLEFPSVGATENLMMAAVTLDGVTTINNAAREPEIVDLQNFMRAIGYDVRGAGTSVIKICGESNIKSVDVEYTIMPDRIVAGTIMCATAATRGRVVLHDIRACDITAIVAKMREMGCETNAFGDSLCIDARGELKAVQNTETMPYPGFPTDMQAQLFAVCATLDGTSVIKENLYENRFRHAGELMKMGAGISLYDRTAVIRGSDLHGASVVANDLRGGAALVIAGLAASGVTIVENPEKYIDRGYEHIENMLSALGADIIRVKE